MRADVPFSLFFLKLRLVQNYRSTCFIVDVYRPWPVALVVLQVRMFITMNELGFATQFMSPMSTGLDNCNRQFIAKLKVVRNSFPFSILTELYERLTRL